FSVWTDSQSKCFAACARHAGNLATFSVSDTGSVFSKIFPFGTKTLILGVTSAGELSFPYQANAHYQNFPTKFLVDQILVCIDPYRADFLLADLQVLLTF
ncbi:hypothetical protein GWN26_00445, partial [Candidatus Saccharibacteria bacterium]|nr:hypothetical protein [Candidatus Saccharibacteria bacterium]